MSYRRALWGAAILTLALVSAPREARADFFEDFVQIDAKLLTGGGAQFSFLHTASSGCSTVDGIQFCMSGSTDKLTGSLSAIRTIDTGTNQFTLRDVAGTLSGANGSSIVIVDGFISGTLGGIVGASDGTNFLEYSSLKYKNETAFGPGKFYFFNESFTGDDGFPVPNAVNALGTDVRLWGNNWRNGTDAMPIAAQSFGIDLAGYMDPDNDVTTPEPSFYTLLTLALGGLFWASRRRRGAGPAA